MSAGGATPEAEIDAAVAEFTDDLSRYLDAHWTGATDQ